MLATTSIIPMDLPCPEWECYYRKPDGNYARPGVDNPQKDVRLDDDSSSPEIVLAKGPMDSESSPGGEGDGPIGIESSPGGERDGQIDIESSTDRDEEPPTWSFDCFDRKNYCWLKKAL